MINFFKRHYKIILPVFILILVSVIGLFTYDSKEDVVVAQTTTKKEKIEEKEEKENVSTVFVDVKGAVNAPGVYEIDSNKRIIDAINLAGGLSDKADTINLNLSKKVEDEMYIVVYTKTELYEYKKKNSDVSTTTCASLECTCPDKKNDACINTKTETAVTGKISINTATKEELMTLTGIGESKANAIITYRSENGKYNNIEDIKNVSGIGESLYEQIKNNITL